MSSRDDIEWGGPDMTYTEAYRRHLERQAEEEEQRHHGDDRGAHHLPDEITEPGAALRWLEANVEIVHAVEGEP